MERFRARKFHARLFQIAHLETITASLPNQITGKPFKYDKSTDCAVARVHGRIGIATDDQAFDETSRCPSAHAPQVIFRTEQY
jgi:hypothetical protein